jgi:hypothetical protein
MSFYDSSIEIYVRLIRIEIQLDACRAREKRAGM